LFYAVRPRPPVQDDLVKRDFRATEMNQVWLTDITEHKTIEGTLYMASLLDVFSGRIVGYSIGSRMTSDLAVSALRNAISLRSPTNSELAHNLFGRVPGSFHGQPPTPVLSEGHYS